MTEFKKDPLIAFKNPKEKVNKHGKMSYTLYLEPEEAIAMAEILIEKGQSPSGVRLDLHFNEGTNGTTGAKFLKAFSFIKEKGTGPIGRPGFTPTPKKMVEKESPEDTRAKLEAARSRIANKRLE